MDGVLPAQAEPQVCELCQGVGGAKCFGCGGSGRMEVGIAASLKNPESPLMLMCVPEVGIARKGTGQSPSFKGCCARSRTWRCKAGCQGAVQFQVVIRHARSRVCACGRILKAAHHSCASQGMAWSALPIPRHPMCCHAVH